MAPCTVHGPIPGMAVSSARARRRAGRSGRPGPAGRRTCRSARSRSVLIFRHDSPASRSLPGSTPSSSAGEGRWPPNRSSMRARVRRVAGTDSCWPVTWNSSAPYRSIGGNWAIHARGSKSGRSSMSRASTGSALAQVGARLLQPRGVAGESPCVTGPAPGPLRLVPLLPRRRAGDGVRFWPSGPRRSRVPPTTAPAAKMPAVHQNAVS